VLKSWMKRHYEMAVGRPFEEFIEAAVAANSGGANARGHFGHSGIDVQGIE